MALLLINESIHGANDGIEGRAAVSGAGVSSSPPPRDRQGQRDPRKLSPGAGDVKALAAIPVLRAKRPNRPK
jgi:hypothetical protein